MNSSQQTIAVVGLGYVGLPLALLADKKGYRVIGIDKDERKVNLLAQRIAPFGDQTIAQKVQESFLEVTNDFSRIPNASIIIVCVPTPVDETHLPDLTPLRGACQNIAPYLRSGQLVIIESTINPGICETIALPLLETDSGLKGGKDFYLAHCPERINPGDKQWDVENIPRVIGSLEEQGLNRAYEFYSSIIQAPIKKMGSLAEAEAVKVVENSFRDINIAFVNELALSFSRLGIDITRVIDGAATKPFAFMAHYPGCGVGGHCIPVDPYYLIDYAKRNGFEHDFLSLARRINNRMPAFTAQLVMQGLNEKGIAIKDSKVALLGIAYKPDVDDSRESPSFEISKHLQEYGARVVRYDPYIKDQSDAPTLKDALSGAKAAVIATAHKLFASLTPNDFLQQNVPVLVDGRNCLPKELFIAAGIIYKGIGR